jgi:stearoyl-CoA desaturase (delta-9 desaturase)
MRFKYAEQDLAIYGHNVNADIIAMKQKVSQEYEAFTNTLNDWAALKEQELQAKKASVAEKIHQMDVKLKVDFQLVEQKLAFHRERLETLMRGIKKNVVS